MGFYETVKHDGDSNPPTFCPSIARRWEGEGQPHALAGANLSAWRSTWTR
jgi:hypothetical protein